MFFILLPPTGAVEHDRTFFEKTGDVIWEVPTDKKVIALTFDDGPHSKYTPQVLDLLAKYNAKATFFVIGEHAEEFPEIIQRQIREGHEIANHTYSHYKRQNDTIDEIRLELKKTDDIILKLTGTRTAFFRPIGGNYNDMIINTAVKEGYRVIMWSWHQDTEDWKGVSARRISKKVLNNYRPGDIILFHDAGGNRSQTVKALKKIIPKLIDDGYELVTVSELLQMTGIDDVDPQ